MKPDRSRLSRVVLWVRRHGFWLGFSACLIALWAPLTASWALPFHDASGIVGLAGALAQLDDPAARIRDFYDVQFGAFPSVLYFGWGYVAAKLGIPVELAFNVFVGLFCLIGPALALLTALWAFERPRALVFLAVPIAYHQQIWFGFLGSAASITGLLFSLAFARRAVVRPSWRNHVALAAAVLYVAMAHPFSLALTLAVLAPFVVWPVAVRPAWRTIGARLICFLPALLFLAPWFRGFFGHDQGDGIPWTTKLVRTLRWRRPPVDEDAREFVRWLGDGYVGAWDDVVAVVALATLVLLLIFGVRGRADAASRTWPWLLWGTLFLALGYLLLPLKLFWPDVWWGVRVRCVVPLFLVAIIAVRPRTRGLPTWAVAPALTAGLVYAGYIAYDFRAHWAGKVLDGFDEAVAAIPPGQSVLAMPALPDPHYTRGHPYLAEHYVARQGGRVAPCLLGHRGAYWITPHVPPLLPPWGDPQQFVWEEHSLGYDWFLVETPVGGSPPQPFARAPAGAVELVVGRGTWRAYRKR